MSEKRRMQIDKKPRKKSAMVRTANHARTIEDLYGPLLGASANVQGGPGGGDGVVAVLGSTDVSDKKLSSLLTWAFISLLINKVIYFTIEKVEYYCLRNGYCMPMIRVGRDHETVNRVLKRKIVYGVLELHICSVFGKGERKRGGGLSS